MNSNTPPSIKKQYGECKKRLANQQKAAFLEKGNQSVKRRLVFTPTENEISSTDIATLTTALTVHTINTSEKDKN